MKWLVVLLCLQIASVAICGCARTATIKPSQYAVYAFTAPWCAACRQDKERVNALREAGIEVVEINPKRHPDVAARHGVKTIPYYVVFRGTTIVLRTGDISMVCRRVGV